MACSRSSAPERIAARNNRKALLMTILFVGASPVTNSGSGTLTFTEPAGIQPGDLAVVLIGCASLTPFSPVSGWVGFAALTAVTPLIQAFWNVRGASAPGLQFVRTSGNNALGVMLAFRNVDNAAP